ncbi:MAG: hypothetical protein LBF13_00165 [Campylobacteraceae bacterium]|jgi:uncharacterized membrane protein|nr:hypothetical protein [Campylobacteraceae bacterium]
MRLSAPTQVIFLITLLVAIVAVLGQFVAIPVITPYSFWFLTAAYVLLALGVTLKNL